MAALPPFCYLAMTHSNPKKNSASASTKVRLDKWLWAARFFKTRGLATEAINGGHVHLNGVRAKPSRPLCVGDELKIRKAGQEFVVTVVALSDKRGPAPVAQTLYQESEASRLAREKLNEQKRLERMAAGGGRPERRPDKRSRRHIIRFIRKGES